MDVPFTSLFQGPLELKLNLFFVTTPRVFDIDDGRRQDGNTFSSDLNLEPFANFQRVGSRWSQPNSIQQSKA